jgi:hypothetical protein
MAEFHLSDEEFFGILRENAGLFARTAKAISETYGIEYSRQAARQRALDKPEILADIEDESLDLAEGGMMDLVKSLDDDIKFKACQFVLKTKGKKRGYVERQELAVEGQLGITWNEQKTYETKDDQSPDMENKSL